MFRSGTPGVPFGTQNALQFGRAFQLSGLRTSPRRLYGLAIVAAIAAVPLLLWNGFVQQVNAEWNDIAMRLRPIPTSSEALRRTVLLAVDDRTASRFGPLPLKRDVLAAGLRALATAAPAVLAVDLILAERTSPEADGALAQSFRGFPRLVVGAALDSDGSARPSWILPLEDLRSSASVGHVHAAPDPDGDVRAVLLAKAARDRRLWALGLESARLMGGAARPLETADAILLGSKRIPASASEARLLWINFAGPEGAFHRVSFADLLAGTADLTIFHDKLVILGVTAQGSGDRLFTPLSSGIGMSGIEIHANVARTILDGAFLRPLGPAGELGAAMSLIVVAFLSATRLQGARLFLALFCVAAGLLSAGFVSLSFGLLLPAASLLTIFTVSTAIAGVSAHAVLKRSLAGEVDRRKEYAFRVQAIAHEIKSPLTAIQGTSEMIAEADVPEHKRIEMAGLIHKESKRLTGLVQTFLSVERLASGSIQLQKRPTDLRKLCEEVVERGRLYASRKRIRIELDVPGIEVHADPDLLAFAIYNLITNGVKYSPKSTTIDVRAAADPHAIELSVTDQGFGIAPGDREKVFEKFYRLQRDEKGAEEGTGIGLALVKEIVQQHGGLIAVESGPGGGSRFTMTLPKE